MSPSKLKRDEITYCYYCKEDFLIHDFFRSHYLARHDSKYKQVFKVQDGSNKEICTICWEVVGKGIEKLTHDVKEHPDHEDWGVQRAREMADEQINNAIEDLKAYDSMKMSTESQKSSPSAVPSPDVIVIEVKKVSEIPNTGENALKKRGRPKKSDFTPEQQLVEEDCEKFSQIYKDLEGEEPKKNQRKRVAENSINTMSHNPEKAIKLEVLPDILPRKRGRPPTHQIAGDTSRIRCKYGCVNTYGSYASAKYHYDKKHK